jgi:hypothetical protein
MRRGDDIRAVGVAPTDPLIGTPQTIQYPTHSEWLQMRVELGNHIYLWKTAENNTPAPACVITAHGNAVPGQSRAMNANRLLIPTLHYFCRHREGAQDPGLMIIASGSANIVESIPADQSPDYALAKYTNSRPGITKHNLTNENYETIRRISSNLLKPTEVYAENAFNIMRARQHAQEVGQADWAEDLLERAGASLEKALAPKVTFDVITVRNRFSFGYIEVRLSDVISQLESNGYHYLDIYCCFCRG